MIVRERIDAMSCRLISCGFVDMSVDRGSSIQIIQRILFGYEAFRFPLQAATSYSTLNK